VAGEKCAYGGCWKMGCNKVEAFIGMLLLLLDGHLLYINPFHIQTRIYYYLVRKLTQT
jgi:hypothetical protein